MTREEALKKVRQMSLPKETMEIIEVLAPELAENEDERIRRWLCDYFSSIDKAWIHKDITCIDILRWLEKQKDEEGYEEIPVESTLEYKLGFKAGKDSEKQKEQKPIECELEDAFKYYTDAGITISCGDIVAKPKEQKPADEAEKFFDSAESYNQGFVAGQKKMKEDIEKGFGIGEHSLDYLAGRYAGYTAAKKEQKLEWSDTNELVFQDICKHLKEEGYSGWVVLLNALRNGEFQSKQEWSEEDEEILKLLILNIGRYMYFGGMSSERILSFLKSLRPQQRQEWSEEEKEILDSILSHYVLIDKPIDANGIPKEKYISLIKSIRFDTYKNCNSHWKPSDEQMEAVKHAYNSFPNDCLTKSNLRLLYHDLEKLM